MEHYLGRMSMTIIYVDNDDDNVDDDGMDFMPDQTLERLLYPLLEFNESTFIPEPYIPPQIVTNAHLRPRFGRPNTLAGVIARVNDQTREYITGVVIGSLIIATVAVVWLIAVACLKISGPKRVGFFAGQFVFPCANQEKEEECCGVEIVLEGDMPSNGTVVGQSEVNETMVDASAGPQSIHTFRRRVRVVRVIFVISGIGVIISGGIFYGKGAVSFKNSFEEVQNGIDLFQDVCEKSMILSSNVTKAADDIERQAQPSQETGDGQVCNLNNELSTHIRSIYNELVANIEQLKSTLNEQLQRFNSDILFVLGVTEDIEYALQWAYIFFYVLVAITVVIISLIVAMMVGVFFAWKGIYNSVTKCIQYALIWPLFIFSLVLSWIFATLFLAAGLAGADFCVSPDQYIEDFLYAHTEMFDGILFGFLIYYVSGCTITPPGAKYMREISNEIAAVMTTAHELILLVADLSVESIAQLCNVGIEQATDLKQISTLGHAIIHTLNRTFVGLRQVISCGTMNPIYTTIVHQALCEEAVAGMSWIFFTTLLIAIFSMLMLTFRAALYPINDLTPPVRNESGIEVVKYNVQSNAPDKLDGGACPLFESITEDEDDFVHVAAPVHARAPPDSEEIVEDLVQDPDCVDGIVKVQDPDCVSGIILVQDPDCIDGIVKIQDPDCIDGIAQVQDPDCIDGIVKAQEPDCIDGIVKIIS